MYKVLLVLFAATLTACTYESKTSTKEYGFKEMCYGGVVYIERLGGYTNLSVKFNPDNTVATEMFDGVKCK